MLDAVRLQSGVPLWLECTRAAIAIRQLGASAGRLPAGPQWLPWLPTSPPAPAPLPPFQKRGCMTHHRLWTAPELSAADVRVRAPAAGLHVQAPQPAGLPAAAHLARSPLPVRPPAGLGGRLSWRCHRPTSWWEVRWLCVAYSTVEAQRARFAPPRACCVSRPSCCATTQLPACSRPAQGVPHGEARRGAGHSIFDPR